MNPADEALARHFDEDVRLVDPEGARVTVHLPMSAKTAAGVFIRLGKLGFNFERSGEGHTTGERPELIGHEGP